jgi:hypothetical protein
MNGMITIEDYEGFGVFIYKEVAEALGLQDGQRVDKATMDHAIIVNAHVGIAICEEGIKKTEAKMEAE